MSGWNFFKDIYVVSLKTANERRAQCASELRRVGIETFQFIDGIVGKANPLLRQSYADRGILTATAPVSPGAFGCLASHRWIWESALSAITSPEPFWILILEDDVKFHPLFTTALLQSYLDAIPPTAGILKFGFLAGPRFSERYTVENSHWMAFGSTPSFATHCYAVKSTHLRHLLNLRFNKALDCVVWPAAYGASNPEKILGLPSDSYMDWRMYYNPYIKEKEPYHGFVACVEETSSTYEPATPA